MSIRPLALTAALCAAVLAAPALAQDGAAPAAPPAAAAGEKVKLAVCLQKGQTFAVDVAVKIGQQISVAGMDMETDIDLNTSQFNSVDAVDEKGVATLRSTVSRIHGRFSNPMMGELEFDSDKPAEEDDGNPMSAMVRQFTAGAGRETVVKITPAGKVEGGSGEDQETLRQMGGMSALPEGAVGVGDSWTNESAMNQNGLKMKVRMKNTVKALDADHVTILHDGAIELDAGDVGADDADGNPMAAAMKKMKLKSSKIAGETRMSRKDGFMTTSDMKIEMDMSMEADPEATDMTAAGMTMKMTQTFHQERKPAAAAPEKKPAPAPAPDLAPAPAKPLDPPK